MHLHLYRDESRSGHFDLVGEGDHPWTIDLVIEFNHIAHFHGESSGKHHCGLAFPEARTKLARRKTNDGEGTTLGNCGAVGAVCASTLTASRVRAINARL
jgi:hypothetical protein